MGGGDVRIVEALFFSLQIAKSDLSQLHNKTIQKGGTLILLSYNIKRSSRPS